MYSQSAVPATFLPISILKLKGAVGRKGANVTFGSRSVHLVDSFANYGLPIINKFNKISQREARPPQVEGNNVAVIQFRMCLPVIAPW